MSRYILRGNERVIEGNASKMVQCGIKRQMARQIEMRLDTELMARSIGHRAVERAAKLNRITAYLRHTDC